MSHTGNEVINLEMEWWGVLCEKEEEWLEGVGWGIGVGGGRKGVGRIQGI